MAMISIIVPTYNGDERLAVLLKGLADQTNSDFELIVVIDGSTDQTESVLRQHLGLFKDMKIHLQKNGGRARARNAGAQLANSNRLLFLDDDVIPGPDLVGNHVSLAGQNPSSIFFGTAFLRLANFKDSFSKYRIRIESGWMSKARNEEISFASFKFTSQNFSIEKFDFIEVGGFDERLSDSEDFDFAVRWLLEGRGIRLAENLTVGHFDRKNIIQFIERQKKYYKSKLDLLSLHPEYAKLLHNHFAFRSIPAYKKFIALYLYPENLIAKWWDAYASGFPIPVPDILTGFHIWQQVFISGK